FVKVERQEEVPTSRHIIQRHTTRNIPLAHPSCPLMLPVQFPQGDDTGLRDGPDRHARTRPSSYLVPQTLRPEGTRHHHCHPPTRSHSRSHDSHRLLMVPRSLWSHTQLTTNRNLIPDPSWKQLYNNTHHSAKQPILLQHHPIDPNLSSNHQNLASKLLGNSSQTNHIPVVPKPTSRSAEGPISCRTSRE